MIWVLSDEYIRSGKVYESPTVTMNEYVMLNRNSNYEEYFYRIYLHNTFFCCLFG